MFDCELGWVDEEGNDLEDVPSKDDDEDDF